MSTPSDHDHGDHAHAKESHGHAHEGEHHGLGHVASKRVLLGTWGTLMVLTVVTVTTSRIHLGSAEINLAVAMLIATVKASLVCIFFMHLKYDKRFHTVVFVSAILLATLFVTFTLMDSGQYQSDVKWEKDDLSPSPY